MTDLEGEIYTRLRKSAATLEMLAEELQRTQGSILAVLVHVHKQERVSLCDDGYLGTGAIPKVTFYDEQ